MALQQQAVAVEAGIEAEAGRAADLPRVRARAKTVALLAGIRDIGSHGKVAAALGLAGRQPVQALVSRAGEYWITEGEVAAVDDWISAYRAAEAMTRIPPGAAPVKTRRPTDGDFGGRAAVARILGLTPSTVSRLAQQAQSAMEPVRGTDAAGRRQRTAALDRLAASGIETTAWAGPQTRALRRAYALRASLRDDATTTHVPIEGPAYDSAPAGPTGEAPHNVNLWDDEAVRAWADKNDRWYGGSKISRQLRHAYAKAHRLPEAAVWHAIWDTPHVRSWALSQGLIRPAEQPQALDDSVHYRFAVAHNLTTEAAPRSSAPAVSFVTAPDTTLQATMDEMEAIIRTLEGTVGDTFKVPAYKPHRPDRNSRYLGSAKTALVGNGEPRVVPEKRSVTSRPAQSAKIPAAQSSGGRGSSPCHWHRVSLHPEAVLELVCEWDGRYRAVSIDGSAEGNTVPCAVQAANDAHFAAEYTGKPFRVTEVQPLQSSG
jgi:hypothetical protein